MSGRLPARDLWLLPLISGLTAFLLLLVAEVGARAFWPEQKENACAVRDLSPLRFHYKPGCVSRMKAAEGPWYTNQYNACGYRTDAPCGPAAPGVRRIALIGASLSEGYLVEYPDTIGATLDRTLEGLCRSQVEVENLAGAFYHGRKVLARMAQARELHPQAVVLVQNPTDIQTLYAAAPPQRGRDRQTPDPATDDAAASGNPFRMRLSRLFRDSRTVVVAQHFLYRDPAFYWPLFLASGDRADFLRLPFTAPWRERLTRFDRLLTELSEQAHQADVPLILVFVPQRAQIAMAANGPPPPGVDPMALPRVLEAISRRHDVMFIDTSTALSRVPDPSDLYYRADGHPSGKGQQIIGRVIARRIADANAGAFSDCQKGAGLGRPPSAS